MSDKQNELLIGLSEGVAVAVFSGLGYSFAYLYEAAYFSFYKVPIGYIEIGFTQVIGVAFILFLVTVSGIFFVLSVSRIKIQYTNFVTAMIKVMYSPAFIVITTLTLFVALFSLLDSNLKFGSKILYLLKNDSFNEVYTFGGFYILNYIFLRFYPAVFPKDTSTSLKNVLIGIQNLLIIFYLISVPGCVGEFAAKSRVNSQIVDGYPGYTVVRIYGDKAILSKFDESKSVYAGDIIILKISESNPLHIKFKPKTPQ
jgi:hypothetical protein